MGLIYWLAFVVTSVAFIPSLDARLSDCFEVTGLLVPVFTPVDEYGALDVDVIPQYAQYLRDKGVNGVIVATTTGEGPAMNVSDNKKLLDAWMEAAPPLNLLVISSVGAIPFPNTLEMTRYSEEIGVDALFALPEVYYKPQNAEELVYNIELIAREAPETPLVYDDVPEYTGVNDGKSSNDFCRSGWIGKACQALTDDNLFVFFVEPFASEGCVDIVEFYELAEAKINTFRGLKSTVFDNLLKLRTRTRGQQQLYVSNATYLAPAVFLGFENYALAELNFFPTRIIDIINNGRKGNLTRTTNLYQRLIDLIDLIIEKGKNLAAYKATMPLLTGIDVGDVREPIYPLSNDEKQDLEYRLRNDGKQSIINSQREYAD